jgi:hypothetical protein
VRNLFGQEHDLWSVNADDEYHEEIAEARDDAAAALSKTDLRNLGATQPLVPATLSAQRVARSSGA